MATASVARPTADDRIKAALWFAERGFGVFSVWSTTPDGVCRCPKGPNCGDNTGKHPITAHGFQDATTDPERIRRLLAAGSEPNYGVVPPPGVFALDVDGSGVARLAELEGEYGPLPETLLTKTANGSHLFFRWPEGLPRPLSQIFKFVTRWGSGSNAGYVIGPRSVHPSGAVYAPGSSFEIATFPDAWARAVVKSNWDETGADGEFEIPAGGYVLPDFGYAGSRYDAIVSYIASRYMRGLSVDEIWAGVLSVLAPRFAEQLSEPDLRNRFDRAWKKTPERLGPPDVAPAIEVAVVPDKAVLVETREWPAAPDDAAYHGVLGDIVTAVAPRTEADPVAILGTLLAFTGACMGSGRAIYQGSTQTANLFVALVGDSSTGRKGTASSIGRDVMNAAYPEWQSLIVAGLGSGEGLIAHLKRVEDRDEHRALVMESEFGRLLTVMAREGSTLSPVVRDAWDGVPMGRFLAREQSLVQRHHVGIAAHVTTVELQSKLTSTDAANGFGNRFLWLAVRRTKLVPFPESPKDVIRDHVQPLALAIDSARVPGDMHWSPEAADRWESLYAESAARARYGLLGSLLARAEAQIARLALLYALLDRSASVDVQHLRAAEALWAFNERSVIYIFGSSTGDRHADALREYLTEGALEWESAKRALGLRSAADLRSAVDVLVALDIAEVVTAPRDGGGRARRIIRRKEIGGAA